MRVIEGPDGLFYVIDPELDDPFLHPEGWVVLGGFYRRSDAWEYIQSLGEG